MEFVEIKDGINLNVIETKKFKTISLGVLIRTKLDRKTATFNAILPNLLLSGCEKYKAIREINLKTEEMGGSNFYLDIMKKGDSQILEFLIDFPENIEDKTIVFEFLANIIFKPLVNLGAFKKEYFDRARALTIDKIKAQENDKKEFAKIRCIKNMFKGEDFGINADGYIQDFEENFITEKSLYEHYKKLLQQCEIDIIAVGNIKRYEVEDFVKKYFIVDGRAYKKSKNEFYYKDKIKPNFIEEKFNITQGKLCIGFRAEIEANSKLFLPLLVGNEILGGSSSSKLFNNVREKESLCYYINSFVFLFKGVIFVQSGVDFNQSDKVIEYIKKEVENIKKGDFNEEDISNAKINLEKKYLSIVDYNTSIMDFYYTNFLADVSLNIEETMSIIKKVTKKEISDSFSKVWLDTTYFMKGE